MRTLLIVDDNPAAQQTLALIFKEKYAILTASTGKEALAAIKQADAVLLDLNLPDTHGRDLLPKLKKARQGVVCITVSGDSEQVKGADAHFLKPIPIPQVMSTLEALLQ